MIKAFKVAFLLLVSYNILAQEGTSSPYSFYGLGHQKFQGSVENRMMGGLNAHFDSIHVNLANPATYSTLKFSTYTLGATQNFNELKTSTSSAPARRTTLDYLAIAIPTGKKLGFGLGLMPYSSVGYRVVNLTEETNGTSTSFEGSGGVNKAFFGASYKIAENFHFGAEIQYYFGNINSSTIAATNGVQYGTREENTTNVTGFGTNFGLTYHKKLAKNYFIQAHSTFSPNGTFNLNNTRSINLVLITSSGEFPVDEAQITNLGSDKLNLPASFQIGGGIGKDKKWFVGVEYASQQMSNFGNRYASSLQVNYENAQRFSLGGQYIPKYNSFSSYWSRVTYRAGFRFENTGLVIENESIRDSGITFGLGLPIGYSISNINVGFEFGKRGTTRANLVEENYFNLLLSISFNDRWFVKRKYD
jgi:hypothetical protein